ncbi:SMP-30/gluconolactonase/LRE family protein [Thalassospira lucentensis]|uniref:SMP-30/gluconolactonase/LRE family protein n=1 Tax=Thalassospira lucentensis TaxID=168935 RepID=UPI003D2F3A15
MISLDNIEFVGQGLNRPECVLTHKSGLLFAADWTKNGGVSIIGTDHSVHHILSKDSSFEVRPNGIAVEQKGSFLLAHLGPETGGLFRLYPDGTLEDVLTELDGTALPPSNYVHIDTQGRTWITVSTRQVPRAAAYRGDVADGYVILIDEIGARIVADDIGYTNECLVHPDGKRLFVNETFARKLSSFDIDAKGNLSNKKIVCEFGAGTFPDGMTFDTEGGIWITSIVSNRVIRVTEDGTQEILIEDVDQEHLDNVEDAFGRAAMGRPHLDRAHSQKLKNISSLAFGGADLKTAYLGCLLGDQIARFQSPFSGVKPAHWDAPLSKLRPLLSSNTPQ